MAQAPISIRQAEYSDLECIYRFVGDLEQQKIDFTAFGKIFTTNIRNTNYRYLIAMVENQPAGFISLHTQLLLHHGGRVGEIQELYVGEKWRRNGVARQLITTVADLALGWKLSSLEVATNIRRCDAVALYEACGFTRSHWKYTKEL